jgi:hypothetical protein
MGRAQRNTLLVALSLTVLVLELALAFDWSQELTGWAVAVVTCGTYAGKAHFFDRANTRPRLTREATPRLEPLRAPPTQLPRVATVADFRAQAGAPAQPLPSNHDSALHGTERKARGGVRSPPSTKPTKTKMSPRETGPAE